MTVPVRFPSGVSTARINTPFGNFPFPDPTRAVVHFDDFLRYTAGDWTVATGANAGSAALAAGTGGTIVLTTAAVTTADYESLALNPAPLNFTSAQQVWFETRFQVSDATNPILLAGITAGALGATLAPTDGIYFKKASAATTFSLVLTKASTSTTLAIPAASLTLANATEVRLGFYYNGKDSVDVYVNDVKVLSQTTLTNLPTATALTTGFGIVNGAAAAKTMTVDLILAAHERSI